MTSKARKHSKSESIFAKAKNFINGAMELSIVLREPDGDALSLPPAGASRRDLVNTSRNVSASSSHIASGKADSCELQAPPLVSYQEDDRAFDLAVQEVKKTVSNFAQALISDMARFPEGLEPLKKRIRRDSVEEKHWKFLVQAFVAERLFADFVTENGYFGVEYFDGMKSTPFISFADYCKFKDKPATISGLRAQTSPDVSFLGKFCFQKFKSICGDVVTNRPLPVYQEDWGIVAAERHPKSEFYLSFLHAAVSVWLLHRLVHTSDQGWKMLGWETYPKGSKFQREFMEPVVPGAHTKVCFLVLPGFQMSNSVVKCEVFPRFESSTTSLEFSYGSTGTSAWSNSTSTVWSNSTFGGRPHEISEPGGRPTSKVKSEPSGSSSKPSRSSSQPSRPVSKGSGTIHEGVLKKYSWDQVLQMKSGADSLQLGQGGFGIVYLGKLESGKEVALKILDRSSQQGIPEFLNEVHLLGRVNHVNLVRLLGFCQDEEQVLIYEFAEEGSVWDHLHGHGKWLDWKQRLSIALQAACGLEYLHTLCNPRIIHRDVKSENILITKAMVAQVADFGLSKVGADDDNNWKSHVTTKVSGTRGYLDPEYHLTGQLRDSSDVFSFGIVLLEIITGRKPVPNHDPKCAITNWVGKTYGSGGSKAVKAVADPLFSDNYNPKALKLVISLALSCTDPTGESRPKISEVVRVLRKAQTLELGEKKSWASFL